jgi:xanthine dehydrogenase small subunit
MRDTILLHLNGQRHEISGAEAFMTLSDFLRYQRGLTGTKVVCAEGDCGACTVLVAHGDERYQSINSCIAFMWQLDRSHVITVEGLKKDGVVHPVQESMVTAHGAQCGYCTPGFICAMAGMTEDARIEGFSLEEKRVRNYLTGNLCRCTGYQAIIEAGCKTDMKAVPDLKKLYPVKTEQAAGSVHLKHQGLEIFLPSTIAEAVETFNREKIKIVSGATDLGVLYNKGKWAPEKMMSLAAIAELKNITEEKDALVVGARASLTQLETATVKLFPELSRMLHLFASPQIKNTGTLIGNMMNASPIADTIPFLKVAEAEVVLVGPQGQRSVNVNAFFQPGYKKMDLRAGEIVTHVRIPKTADAFRLYKVSKRKDMDISAVTCAIRYRLDKDVFASISIAFGGVGASVLRFPDLETLAVGQKVTPALMRQLGVELDKQITPVSDVRGSDKYRRLLCTNLLMKFGDELTAQWAPREVSL